MTANRGIPRHVSIVDEAGVPCGAVRNIDQVIADPHTRHRGMVVDVGAYRGTGSPISPMAIL